MSVVDMVRTPLNIIVTNLNNDILTMTSLIMTSLMTSLTMTSLIMTSLIQ